MLYTTSCFAGQSIFIVPTLCPPKESSRIFILQESVLREMCPAFSHIVCDSVQISHITLGIKAIRRNIKRNSPLPCHALRKNRKSSRHRHSQVIAEFFHIALELCVHSEIYIDRIGLALTAQAASIYSDLKPNIIS